MSRVQLHRYPHWLTFKDTLVDNSPMLRHKAVCGHAPPTGPGLPGRPTWTLAYNRLKSAQSGHCCEICQETCPKISPEMFSWREMCVFGKQRKVQLDCDGKTFWKVDPCRCQLGYLLFNSCVKISGKLCQVREGSLGGSVPGSGRFCDKIPDRGLRCLESRVCLTHRFQDGLTLLWPGRASGILGFTPNSGVGLEPWGMPDRR